jgi:hypothetical protein
MEFLAHIDTCEEVLANMPEWIRKENAKQEQVITDRDKMNLSEDTLILMNQIPQSSLSSRAYQKFKELRNISPGRFTFDEQENVAKNSTTNNIDIESMMRMFEELKKDLNTRKNDIEVKKIDTNTNDSNSKKDEDEYAAHFSDDSSSNDEEEKSESQKVNNRYSVDLLSNSARKPIKKHLAYVSRGKDKKKVCFILFNEDFIPKHRLSLFLILISKRSFIRKHYVRITRRKNQLQLKGRHQILSCLSIMH